MGATARAEGRFFFKYLQMTIITLKITFKTLTFLFRGTYIFNTFDYMARHAV